MPIRVAAGEWISIAVTSDADWEALADAMGQPALKGEPRFKRLADRKAHEDELDRLLAAWTRGRDARELALELQQRGIAAAKSQTSVDLVADEHLWARGFYREVTGRRMGQARTIVGPSWKMSREAALSDAAPRLGEHNAYVLGQILGISAAEQQKLSDAGITR